MVKLGGNSVRCWTTHLNLLALSDSLNIDKEEGYVEEVQLHKIKQFRKTNLIVEVDTSPKLEYVIVDSLSIVRSSDKVINFNSRKRNIFEKFVSTFMY